MTEKLKSISVRYTSIKLYLDQVRESGQHSPDLAVDLGLPAEISEVAVSAWSHFLYDPDKIDSMLNRWIEEEGVTLYPMPPKTSQGYDYAVVRREIMGAGTCEVCDGKGFITYYGKLGHMEVVTYADDKVRHYGCAENSPGVNIEQVLDVIPPSHRKHRCHELKPINLCKLSSSAQAEAIKNIPHDPVRSWLLVGPAGTSKTTYVSAAIIDHMTQRLWATSINKYSYFDPFGDIGTLNIENAASLNVWRIKVPDWIAEQQAWDYRNYEDTRAIEPAYSLRNIQKRIRKETTEYHYYSEYDIPPNFSPILWLEELDKCAMSETQKQYVFRLVDCVYEAGGAIYTTSNMTLEALRKHVGDAIYRRVSGECDDPKGALVWNFFAACPKARKK